MQQQRRARAAVGAATLDPAPVGGAVAVGMGWGRQGNIQRWREGRRELRRAAAGLGAGLRGSRVSRAAAATGAGRGALAGRGQRWDVQWRQQRRRRGADGATDPTPGIPAGNGAGVPRTVAEAAAAGEPAAPVAPGGGGGGSAGAGWRRWRQRQGWWPAAAEGYSGGGGSEVR